MSSNPSPTDSAIARLRQLGGPFNQIMPSGQQSSNPFVQQLIKGNVNPLMTGANGAQLGANSGAGQTPQPGTPEYLAYLTQTLINGLNAGQPSMPTTQELRNQAVKSAANQFDPQIKALYNEMGRAKKQAGQNRKDLGGLYSNLASSYIGDIKVSAADTKAAKKAEQSALKNLQKQVGDQYAQSIGGQAQELSKLGISDALPSSTAGQKNDLNFLNSLNATESGAQQRAIDLQGLGDTSYYKQGQGIARTEGAQNIADMMGKLNDYLNQEGTQVAGLQGQKSAAINDFINKAQSGQSDALTKWQNDRWSRIMQLAQMQQQQIKDNKAGTTSVPTKGLEGAQAVLNQMLGTGAGAGMSALQNLFQTQPFTENRFQAANKRDYLKMNPMEAVNQARAYALKNHLTPAETDALAKAVYAYYGQLK